jgi:hypothetical protein
LWRVHDGRFVVEFVVAASLMSHDDAFRQLFRNAFVIMLLLLQDGDHFVRGSRADRAAFCLADQRWHETAHRDRVIQPESESLVVFQSALDNQVICPQFL